MTTQILSKPSRLTVQPEVNSYSRFEITPTLDDVFGLLSELRSKTPFLNRAPHTKQSVLRSYDQAANQLAGWKEESIRFIQAMFDDACELCFEEPLDEFPRPFESKRAMQDLLTEFYHFRPTSMRAPKSLDLLGRRTAVVYAELSNHHDQALSTFVRELVGLLNTMQCVRLVGVLSLSG